VDTPLLTLPGHHETRGLASAGLHADEGEGEMKAAQHSASAIRSCGNRGPLRSSSMGRDEITIGL